MKLISENIYHIYNRGNNAQQIFFKTENYNFFIDKIENYILPHCDIFSYCLMPNHFHIMVYVRLGFNETKFAQNLRTLLSSYTRAINLQLKRTGSLFQQNSKAKCLSSSNAPKYLDYALTCFHYIHQNPLTKGLVTRMEDWVFSSFREYIGVRKDLLCNVVLAKELLGLPGNHEDFYKQSYDIISDDKVKRLF